MFEQDLREASRFEQALLTYFQTKGYNAWLNPAQDLDGQRQYDIGVSSSAGERKLEAKCDFFSIHSMNFVIEEPTLNHSLADFFVVGLVQPYVFTRDEFQKLYDDHKKVLGGEGKRTRMALVPKSVLKDQHDEAGNVRQARTGRLLWSALKTNELFQ